MPPEVRFSTQNISSPAPTSKSKIQALCINSVVVVIQSGKKVFSQPLIVQVLPLKKMRPVIFIIGIPQLWETKWEKKKKSRKSNCLIFKEFICKLWWKISILSITKGHLNTLLYPLLAMTGQTFSVSLHKGFTHCCWYFGPFLHADLL